MAQYNIHHVNIVKCHRYDISWCKKTGSNILRENTAKITEEYYHMEMSLTVCNLAGYIPVASSTQILSVLTNTTLCG